jgi:hypothetical protein
MLLTSMGIFGFLSKAHLDQAIPTGDVQSKLALIDEKIKTEKENINASRKELSQLDAQVGSNHHPHHRSQVEQNEPSKSEETSKKIEPESLPKSVVPKPRSPNSTKSVPQSPAKSVKSKQK